MIHDVFHVSLLEKNTTKKGQADKVTSQIELDKSDSEKYKVEAICDNAFYTNESEGPLPGLYYLISWKNYPEEENT